MEEKSEKSPFCHNFLLKERDIRVLVVTGLDQRTLTVGGRITVGSTAGRLQFSKTGFDQGIKYVFYVVKQLNTNLLNWRPNVQ